MSPTEFAAVKKAMRDQYGVRIIRVSRNLVQVDTAGDEPSQMPEDQLPVWVDGYLAGRRNAGR